jgi:hypothetical protein
LLPLVAVIVPDYPLEFWKRLYAAMGEDDLEGKKNHNRKVRRDTAEKSVQKVLLCALCGSLPKLCGKLFASTVT